MTLYFVPVFLTVCDGTSLVSCCRFGQKPNRARSVPTDLHIIVEHKKRYGKRNSIKISNAKSRQVSQCIVLVKRIPANKVLFPEGLLKAWIVYFIFLRLQSNKWNAERKESSFFLVRHSNRPTYLQFLSYCDS